MATKLKISLASIISVILFLIYPVSSDQNLSTIPVEPIVVTSIPEVPMILKKISWCESQNKQFNDDGSIHRGQINPKDIGKYQINEYWNGEEALRLGFDIYTLEGNTKMALYLYKGQSSTPWNWSRGCWGDPDRVWFEVEGEYISK